MTRHAAPPPATVVVVSTDALRELIESAITTALARQKDEPPTLSAVAAAKHVRRRVGDVLDALSKGTLHGERRGRRWLVSPAAIEMWAKS